MNPINAHPTARSSSPDTFQPPFDPSNVSISTCTFPSQKSSAESIPHPPHATDHLRTPFAEINSPNASQPRAQATKSRETYYGIGPHFEGSFTQGSGARKDLDEDWEMGDVSALDFEMEEPVDDYYSDSDRDEGDIGDDEEELENYWARPITGSQLEGGESISQAQPHQPSPVAGSPLELEDPEVTETEMEEASEASDGPVSSLKGPSQRALEQRESRLRKARQSLADKHERPAGKIAILKEDGGWQCRRCGYSSLKPAGNKMLNHYASGRCKTRRRQAKKLNGGEIPPPLASSSPSKPANRLANHQKHSSVPALGSFSTSFATSSTPRNHLLPANPTTTSSSTPIGAVSACQNVKVPLHPNATLSDYPYGPLHLSSAEPWQYAPVDGVLYIRSKKCDGTVREEGQVACARCRDLLKDRRVRLLRFAAPGSRILNKLRLDRRTFNELVQGHRRQALIMRDQFFENRHLKRSLKRSKVRNELLVEILQAVARLPPSARAAAVISHALENKGGYRTILRNLLAAEMRHRRLRHWAKIEIAAFIVASLTGRNRCVAALHGSIGAPGRTFLREKIGKCHLVPAIGSPQQIVAAVLENLTIHGFPPIDPTTPLPPITNLYTIGADEVAAQSVIEYNPRTNCFVGLGYRKCVNSGFDIGFNSMDDARETHRLLESGDQDYITNIKAMGLIFHDRGKLGYHFYPLVLMGEGRTGRDAVVELSIWNLIEDPVRHRLRPYGLAPGGSASDGDGPRALMEQRRSCKVEITEKHSLFDRIKRMVGFTPRVGEHDTAPENDPKHILKSVRSCDARPNGQSVGDVALPPPTTLHHVSDAFPDEDHMEDMFPQDAMKVAPCVALIKAKAAVPLASTLPLDTSNIYRRQREALNFSASAPALFLSPFVNAALSTRDGLLNWAQAGWEAWIRFRLNPTNGFTSQLVLALLKSTHAQFVRAMRRQDIAVANGIDVEHILIASGEDPIETFFGGVKLSSGFDTHVTLNSMARVGGEVTLLSKITNEFPSLLKGSKGHRNITTATGADHASPKNLTGDLNVRYINFPEIWNLGREQAFAHARQYPHVIPAGKLDDWEQDLADGRADFLRPDGWYLRWDRNEQVEAGVNLVPLNSAEVEALDSALAQEPQEDELEAQSHDPTTSLIQSQGVPVDAPARKNTSTKAAGTDYSTAILAAGGGTDDEGETTSPGDTDEEESGNEDAEVCEFGERYGEENDETEGEESGPEDGLTNYGVTISQFLFHCSPFPSNQQYLLHFIPSAPEIRSRAPDANNSTPAPPEPSYPTMATAFPTSIDAIPLPSRSYRRSHPQEFRIKRCQVPNAHNRPVSKSSIVTEMTPGNRAPRLITSDRQGRVHSRHLINQKSQSYIIGLTTHVEAHHTSIYVDDTVAFRARMGKKHFLLIGEASSLNMNKDSTPLPGFGPEQITNPGAFIRVKVVRLHPTPPPIINSTISSLLNDSPPPPQFHTLGCDYLKNASGTILMVRLPASQVIKITGHQRQINGEGVVVFHQSNLSGTLEALDENRTASIPETWSSVVPYRLPDNSAILDITVQPPPRRTPPTTATAESSSTNLVKCAHCSLVAAPAVIHTHIAYLILFKGHPADSCPFCGSSVCDFKVNSNQFNIEDITPKSGHPACPGFLAWGKKTSTAVCRTSKESPSSNGPIACPDCPGNQRRHIQITRYGAHEHYSVQHRHLLGAEHPSISLIRCGQRGRTGQQSLGLEIPEDEKTYVEETELKRVEKLAAKSRPNVSAPTHPQNQSNFHLDQSSIQPSTTFLPAPPTQKRRGRPLGSKNKKKKTLPSENTGLEEPISDAEHPSKRPRVSNPKRTILTAPQPMVLADTTMPSDLSDFEAPSFPGAGTLDRPASNGVDQAQARNSGMSVDLPIG
ncbi:hypothetical protein P7C70_g6368, partial [Phenoliferia sp. Uapishka_3]